jgi:SAM-dependent methyltransferase
MDLAALYQHRFAAENQPRKVRIWQTLCSQFFQPLVGRDRTVLDLACGYGEFINAIEARKKYGLDINPDVRKFVRSDVELLAAPATAIPLADCTVDVVFSSNFLEHLRDKAECDQVFAEIRRILRPGGTFIVMGPNIRFLANRYWDFYDHHLPLSHLSLEEGLIQAGYVVEQVIAKFLPYTAKSAIPTHPALVALYLRVPLAWRIMGRQFLVVARKPPARP